MAAYLKIQDPCNASYKYYVLWTTLRLDFLSLCFPMKKNIHVFQIWHDVFLQLFNELLESYNLLDC